MRHAIRHANKGGAFEATDRLGGAQARAQVELDRDSLSRHHTSGQDSGW